MLKASHPTDPLRTDGRFAIVCSRYNAEYTEPMLAAARSILEAAGAREVEVVRVPGAFEIPVAAAALARRRTRRPRAILCLGVIWQGETTHADQIGGAVTRALMSIGLDTGIPCIHEVLTVTTRAQARARCLDPETSRGVEAAHAALEISEALAGIAGPSRGRHTA
ncbi:MAG: 6,7-dimethyl-8-ribityllumazine synthase [Verrucomicrobiota bacterium]|jgi:6,7-dimethyl-8-ribityllumazine synthase|nr:6,7-dimethyl-8-ribityllumazine synthase [Verrucomicrobiota bacterium]